MTAGRRHAVFSTLIGGASSTLIISIQALVLIPLYLSSIGPRLYGAWLGSGDILIWMQAFDLGLPNLMIQRIGSAHGRGDMRSACEYFATGLLAITAIAVIIAFAALAVSPYIPPLMGLIGNEARILHNCFAVGAISAALNIFSNGIVAFSRGIQDTVLINIMVIVAGLIGFGVSLYLVLTGYGLWAITMGLVARNTTVLLGSVIFGINSLRSKLYLFFRPKLSLLREFITVLPVTTLGGFGYIVMNQSESAIVAILIKPELAAVLTLTRKALDIGRGLIDMIAFATYGGFAHLIASEQRQKSLHVYSEIIASRLSLSLIAATAYMAVNAGLVSVWVGSSQYGGSLLTILMAIQFIIVGESFLLNYLFRAAGSIMQGSLALLVESVVRVPLMIGLVSSLGLPGVPIAGIITGVIFGTITYRWTLKQISPFADPCPVTPNQVWWARTSIFALGMIFCIFIQTNSWIYVGAVGLLMVIVGGVVFLVLDPLLITIRVPINNVLNRFPLFAILKYKLTGR